LNGDIFNDIERPMVHIIIQRQITKKVAQDRKLYLQSPTNSKSYIVCLTAQFNDLGRFRLLKTDPRFQCHPIIWRWVSQKQYDVHL